MLKKLLISVTMLITATTFAETVTLDSCDNPQSWRFSNGAEFKGARGKISKDTESEKIALEYDFSKGGKYVSASPKAAIPYGTEKIILSLKSNTKCRAEYRIVDATGRTYHGKTRIMLNGKPKKCSFRVNGSWVGMWGGQKGLKQPKFPLKSFTLLIYGNKTKPGKVIIESCDVVCNAQQKITFDCENFNLNGSGWDICGTWKKSASGPMLELKAENTGTATQATLSIDFPNMGRNHVQNYYLDGSKKNFTFSYSPFAFQARNPNNAYQLLISIHSSNGDYSRKKIILAGDKSDNINFGSPVKSIDIEHSTIGTCTHFSYAAKDQGPFRSWHNYRPLLDMISNAGIKWIRDVVYAKKESDGKYHTNPYDLEWIKYARSKGINVIVLLWLRPKTPVEEAKKYFEAIVMETKDLVDVFEVGNEPENFGFKPMYGGKWNGYAGNGKLDRWVHEFLKYSNAVTDHIKKVRPEITTIGLGAAPSTNFHLLNLGVTKNLDGVTEHAYPFALTPEKMPWGWVMEERDGIKTGDKNCTFVGLINSYAEQFKKIGKMRSLWITEFGFPSYLFNGKNEKKIYMGYSETTQAIYILRRFLLSKTLPIIKVSCQYDFIDDYNSNPFNPEANFGQLRTDRSPKPAYYVIQRMNSLFNGYSYDPKLLIKTEKQPLHKGMVYSRLVKDWDSAKIKASNEVMAFGFASPNKPAQRMIAVWSTQPYNGEASSRCCSIRITEGAPYKEPPVAIDMITGRSFDIPARVDGNDLVFDQIILKNNPIVIKIIR